MIDQIKQWVTTEIDLGSALATYSLQLLAILLVVVVINFFIAQFFKRLSKKSASTKNSWDDAIVNAASLPIRLITWVIGVTVSLEIIDPIRETDFFQYIGPVRRLAVIALLGWVVTRLVKQFEANFIAQQADKENGMDRSTIEAFGKLIRLAIVLTVVLVVLQSLGVSVSGVLAFGGIGGLAIGFAAKDLLANFFGGLMIYLDRPFSVGDWVRSPDQDIEGVVEKIGWRLTIIRRFDKRPLYVPNSVFNTIALENPSRMTHRRIYETIGLRYDDIHQMESVVAQVKDMLLNHDEIDTAQTLIVNFNAFNNSSVDFFVYAYTKTTVWVKYHEVKQDVLLKISQIVENNQAEIAFPTRTLHISPTESLAASHE